MPTTTAPMSFEDWKASQGGSQAAPAPAPAAGKPEMSFEDWKASQSAGPAPKAPAKPYSLGKDVLMSAGALADMGVGFIGDVIGRGIGTGVFALIGALKEDDQEVVWKAATEFGAEMSEANPLAHPVKSIMKWATGDDSGSYDESTVSSVFNKVGGFLQKGGAYVEKETKGAVRAEAVDALLGQITNLAMMKGGEALWAKDGLGKSEAAQEKAPSGPQVGGVAAEAIAKDLAAKPGGEAPKIPMGEGMEEGVRPPSPPSPHGETMWERAARGAAAGAADGTSHDEHPGEAPPAQGYYGERTTPPIEDGQVPYSKPGEHTVDDLVPEPKLPGEPKPNWTENFSLEKVGQVSDAVQATADNMNAASGDPYLASVAPHAPELRPGWTAAGEKVTWFGEEKFSPDPTFGGQNFYTVASMLQKIQQDLAQVPLADRHNYPSYGKVQGMLDGYVKATKKAVAAAEGSDIRKAYIAEARMYYDMLTEVRAKLDKKGGGKASPPTAPKPSTVYPSTKDPSIPTHKATIADTGIGHKASTAYEIVTQNPAIHTPAFKAWFSGADAMVRNADGSPKVFYHGTGGDFLVFKNMSMQTKAGGKMQAGIFASPSFQFAKNWAKYKGPNAKIIPVFISAKKVFDYANAAHTAELAAYMGHALQPHELTHLKGGYWPNVEKPAIVKAIKKLGYDAYTMTETPGSSVKNVAPFKASKVKHAVLNQGAYSKFNPNMYGRASPALMTVMGATVVGAMLDQEDPYTGALFGLAAGALMSKGIGALPHQAVEMAKLGEEFWKPDFHAMLDPKYLGRALQWTKAATGADTTVLWQHLKNARKSGVTEQMDREFRNVSEDPALKASLSPEKAKLYDQYVGALREAMAAQLNKIKDPLERKIVAEEIETRAAKNHLAWWEAVSDPSEGIGPRGFQKTASATKSRTVFALEDGTIITTRRVAGGVGPSGAQLPGSWKVTAWKDNVRTELGYSSEHLKPGTEFNGVKVKSAKQIDIEKHTPIRYVDSDIATHSLKLSELMKYVREKELIDGLLESPGAKGLFVNEKYGQIPEGFVQPQGSMSVPSLKGIFMPKEYAEVFTDFIKKNQGTANLLEGAKNIMIRSMMLNPYAHIMNEMVHWYDSRGLSGFLTPTGVGKYGASKGLYGMAATMPGAIRSVILQDKFQIELQKSGGMLLFPSVKNQMAWNNILQIGLRDAAKTGSFKEMATALATSPARLAKRISDMGSSLMWATRDIMYSQLIKEQMLMGKDMRESIAEVGKHMPEYHIPSRVISDGPAGRIASKTLQSPLLVFSPYHYGMVRAVKEIGKDIASGQAEHMVAGMDRAAAIIAGLAVVYPLLDQLNAQMSGQDIAKQRRAGIYHLISGAGEVFDGKKDPSSLITSMLTPNPAPVVAFEILQNHYLWSGQPIRHEGSSMKAQAADTIKHLISKLAPAQAAVELHEGKKSWEQYALQQLDIQAKTNAQAARTEEARLRRVKAGTTYGKKVEKTYGVDE